MQTPGQYIPFNHKINDIDLIVYPVLDENPLEEIFTNEEDIKVHLNELYEINNITEGRYHILFVWNLDKQRMTDIWIHKLENWSEGCGPLLEVITFKKYKQTNDAGIASGDSIITLGREEELRRNTNTLEDYLDRSKLLPDFMPGFKPNKKF
jgi:hypothetical protein